jgi:uncharacterized protein DUF6152
VKRTLLVLGIGVLVSSVIADAHHYFGTDYFEDQTVSIEGTVVEFDYRNPHSWVYVAAADSAGQMQRIGAEWSSPNRLTTQGVTKETLKPSDRVIITGSPARDPSAYRMHLKKIERPADGWHWVAAGAQR